MPRVDRLSLLVPVLLAVAGCSVDATGVLVTVHTGGCTGDQLRVVVSHGGTPLATHEFAEPVPDGATFGVRLGDELDGSMVTIDVTAVYAGAVECGQSGEVQVVKHRAAPLSLDVGACCPTSDRDASAPPDAGCAPGCTDGVETVCTGDHPTLVDCSFGGCAGAQCAGPPSCQLAGDVSAPRTYGASSAGAAASALGSCEPRGGPNNTLKFGAPQWGSWTLALDASFPAAMWARRTCDDPASELVMGGPCNHSTLGSACLSDGKTNLSQTFCGLPPATTWYAFVGDPGGAGGPYQLTTRFDPVDLNDCPNAGMLPGRAFAYSGDTSTQQDRNQPPASAFGCPAEVSHAPEMVFFVPIPSALDGKLNLRLTVTGRGGFMPLVYAEQECKPASAVCGPMNGNIATFNLDQVPAGAWYIFVDGQSGSMGRFDLQMLLQ